MKYLLFSNIVLFLFCGPVVKSLSAAEPSPENDDLSMYFTEEELVEESTTRAPKPIIQVAENVSIITAEEIAKMHVHSVDEILSRVSGLFVNYNGQDFMNQAVTLIHGSDYEHVLVLLDGIRLNKVSSEIAYCNMVPVQIIKRIEVIKGAASAAWGSALGGVINIITKDPGVTARPAGSLSTSLGEYDSQDFRGDVGGRINDISSYYLAAGYQSSDGILDDRFFDNKTAYGKLNFRLPRQTNLSLSYGLSAPEYKTNYIESWDLQSVTDDRNQWFSAELSMPLAEDFNLYLGGHRLDNDFSSKSEAISSPLVYWEPEYQEKNIGGSGRLTWGRGHHSVVLGAEIERYEEKDREKSTSYQAQCRYEEDWALYANDSIHWGRFSSTLGLRYDHLSLDNSQLSPSLGFTWQQSGKTIFRALVARGFRKSPVGLKSGDPYIYGDVNPDIEAEELWSYQVGMETSALGFCRFKTTLFWHQTDDVWRYNGVKGYYENSGKDEERRGLELEIETRPFHDFSLLANGTYLYHDRDGLVNDDTYTANLIFTYDRADFLRVELSGHYVWWGKTISPSSWNGRYDNFLWNLTLSKEINYNTFSMDLFLVGRNLFNCSQYDDELTKNAGRWVEAGVKIYF